MKKPYPINISAITCLIMVSFIYYLLVVDNSLPFSIGSIISNINLWTRHAHLFVVGLLPIYIACILFGTGIFGIFVGSRLQKRVSHYLQHKQPPQQPCKSNTLSRVRKSPV